MTMVTVEISGVKTSLLQTLTNNELIDLFRQLPNKEIREKIINHNLKLVLSIVKRYKNRNVDLDDLFQVGCIGLIKAIDNFDVNRNIQFSTYAYHFISGEIKKYLRDSHLVHISRSTKDLIYKINQVKEQLSYELGREPNVKEIAKILETSVEEVEFAINASQEVYSLEQPILNHDKGEEINLIDLIDDKNENELKWINHLSIQDILQNLNDRQKLIIYKRYFEDKTQTELSKEFGISQAQISRLEKSALKQMKTYLH